MLDLLVPPAYAQTAAGGAGGMETMMAFLPLILVLVVFYFLVLRPQSQRAKEHSNLLTTLRRGDVVLTTGGFTVTIEKVEETDVLVTFSEDTEPARLLKSAVVSVLEKASDKKPAKRKGKKK